MASPKIRRLAALLCICLLVCGTQAWAGEVRLYHGGASCYVSDMAEGDGTLYYMLTDRETGYQSSIFARAVDGMTAGITYAPDSYEPLAGLHFLHMEPASTGALWAALWDGRANYCVAVLHHGALAAVQPCDTKPCLGDGAAVQWGTEPYITGTGSTMVPLRFVAETFGGTVRWEHGAVHVDLPSQSEWPAPRRGREPLRSVSCGAAHEAVAALFFSADTPKAPAGGGSFWCVLCVLGGRNSFGG